MKKLTPDDFWDRVFILGFHDCWEWLGPKDKDGYGRPHYHGRRQRANRLAWEFTNGAIPEDRWVLHECDTPSCVNPRHLWLGDGADNARDRDRKGRRSSHPPPIKIGEAHSLAKLTDKKVLEMRQMYATGTFTHKKIADQFGITKAAARFAICGHTWKHLPLAGPISVSELPEMGA
jgi:hypothetical protein